jgi:peptide/nickel transport system permease protein
VAADLRGFFPATFELSLTALILSILIGVPAGVVSATARNRLPDHVVRVVSLIGGSVPIFWLGLILIGFFYGRLGWLPGGTRIDKFIPPPPTVTGLFTVDSLLASDPNAFWSSVQHLILPALALGYFSTAIIARMMRSSMLEVLNQQYVLAARAKGLRQWKVVWRHAVRNALIPTVTTIGVTFGSLLSGAVLTETIFSWPGLGRYATNSAISLDFPAVMGVTLLAALVYSATNLIVDVGYHWLDPRIRHG